MVEVRRKFRAALRRLYDGAILGFGLLLAVPLRLVSSLWRIEIQRLRAERIGHLAIEPELFLSLRDGYPASRTTTLFYSTRPIANEFLMDAWRSTLACGPAWLLKPIDDAASRFPWLDLRVRDWCTDHRDLRLLEDSARHIHFSPDDQRRGEDLLRELGVMVGQPFVCLAVRDSAYLAEVLPNRDWSYHDYRDSAIGTYVPMAEWLADQGYAVVRMGAVVRDALESAHPSVIDYARSGLRSDFGDVYLFAHSAFCITTSTGMDSLAQAFRTPMGIVNLAARGGLQVGDHLRLVMFKNAVDITTDEPLVIDSPEFAMVLGFTRSSDFRTAGIRLVDNSPDQLRNFAEELLSTLDSWSSLSATPDPQRQGLIGALGDVPDLSAATFRLAKAGTNLTSPTMP